MQFRKTEEVDETDIRIIYENISKKITSLWNQTQLKAFAFLCLLATAW